MNSYRAVDRTSPLGLISHNDFINFFVVSRGGITQEHPASLIDPTDHVLPSGCSKEVWRAVSVTGVVEIVNS